MNDTSHLPVAGSRVRVVRLAQSPGSPYDDNEIVPPGTEGTVTRVRSSQIWVAWDNGCTLSLLIGEDQWEVVT